MPLSGLLLAGLLSAPGSTADGFRAIHRSWGLVPADPARPGLSKARAARGESVDVLVRLDTTAQGGLRRCEWSAESRRREVDLPEERFWSVLDALSGGKEWIETDPDLLPAGVFEPPPSSLAQGFRCVDCKPQLVAATWSPHGGTRLLVGAVAAPRPKVRFAILEGASEEGIASMANQRSMGVEARNPCRDGGGSCSLTLTGSKGEKWLLSRASGADSWRLVEASFPGTSWWNPEWSWDSLRQESPREFALVLRNWLDAELDVIGARLIRPLEPVLAAGTSDWNGRAVPDLDVGPVVGQLVKSSYAPGPLELCGGRDLRVSIDGFGRRSIRFLKDGK